MAVTRRGGEEGVCASPSLWVAGGQTLMGLLTYKVTLCCFLSSALLEWNSEQSGLALTTEEREEDKRPGRKEL